MILIFEGEEGVRLVIKRRPSLGVRCRV